MEGNRRILCAKIDQVQGIIDLFTVCVYFIQQQNCKLYYIYLMIISEIQSEIGQCSCDSAKLKAPADFSHHAILCFDIFLNVKLIVLSKIFTPLKHLIWKMDFTVIKYLGQSSFTSKKGMIDKLLFLLKTIGIYP